MYVFATARIGMPRPGMAWRAQGSQGLTSKHVNFTRLAMVRLGQAWRGMRVGTKGPQQITGKRRNQRGRARRDLARPGGTRQGKHMGTKGPFFPRAVRPGPSRSIGHNDDAKDRDQIADPQCPSNRRDDTHE